MAWIRLIFVVFCIGSIHGLPQDITNTSEDSKPSDLTKNLLKNPSLVDSKPSDVVDIGFFIMKMALEFIWNQANCYIMGRNQEVDAAILSNCYEWNPESFFNTVWDAIMYAYFSVGTQIAIAMHNGHLVPSDSEPYKYIWL